MTVVAGTAIPATAAFATDDYPVPPSPTVTPAAVTKPKAAPTTEVLGAQVTRGSMPFTGGDVAELAAIGVGAVAVGAVMVRRTRRAKA